MKVRCKLDYDWKYADSTFASCEVELVGKGKPAEALMAADRDIMRETSNQYVSFIPRKVNGESVVATRDFFWTTAACLAFLKTHPEARKFMLEGGME